MIPDKDNMDEDLLQIANKIPDAQTKGINPVAPPEIKTDPVNINFTDISKNFWSSINPDLLDSYKYGHNLSGNYKRGDLNTFFTSIHFALSEIIRRYANVSGPHITNILKAHESITAAINSLIKTQDVDIQADREITQKMTSALHGFVNELSKSFKK